MLSFQGLTLLVLYNSVLPVQQALHVHLQMLIHRMHVVLENMHLKDQALVQYVQLDGNVQIPMEARITHVSQDFIQSEVK